MKFSKEVMYSNFQLKTIYYYSKEIKIHRLTLGAMLISATKGMEIRTSNAIFLMI